MKEREREGVQTDTQGVRAAQGGESSSHNRGAATIQQINEARNHSIEPCRASHDELRCQIPPTQLCTNAL
eukprot:4489156-Pleurochrysis_carterae.AAC.3